MWGATRAYRAEWFARWRDFVAAYSGPLPPRVQKIPLPFILAMEFFAALFGFPGLGWLYAGQALVGIAMLCIGPAVAWALIPLLTSPFADTIFEPYGVTVLFVWLGGTGLLSASFLAGYLRFKRVISQVPAIKSTDQLPVVSTPAPVRPSD
jgi:hypothetical protein